MTVPADRVADFAAEVGGDGPVTCVGGRTDWDVGGKPSEASREVTAPSGVVLHEPAEMIVRVRAGTILAELQRTVGSGGQYVPIEASDPAKATIGGILSVGRNGIRRWGWGPARDAVLEVTAVTARGQSIRAGAPLVKNVTGFDLCRLLVGSLGTLAFIAEVVLRCRPLPEAESWFEAEGADPFEVARHLYRPLSVLWDGERTWVGLEGYRIDIDDEASRVLGPRFSPVEGPPPVPPGGRFSMTPRGLEQLARSDRTAGTWLAQIGVGLVHGAPPWGSSPAPVPDGVDRIHRALKNNFDPTGRLNPGRSALFDASAPAAGLDA